MLTCFPAEHGERNTRGAYGSSMLQMPPKYAKGGDIMELRAAAKAIFSAAVDRVRPERLLSWSLAWDGSVLQVREGQTTLEYEIDRYQYIVLISIGKAAVPMAENLLSMLGNRIAEGLVVTKAMEGELHSDEEAASDLAAWPQIRVLRAGHPVPDLRSNQAGRELLALARRAAEKQRQNLRTLALVLLSGGGSALASCPVEGISAEEKAAVTKLLLGCGASIHEINTVRKHLSAIKGGQLARAFYPAEGLALVLSDVVGDDLDVIASGPTVADRSTWHDVHRIFQHYRLMESLPAAVQQRVELGLAGSIPETPKPEDPLFRSFRTVLVGTNYHAIMEAEREAQRQGFATLVLGTRLQGEAREIAKVFAGMTGDILIHGIPHAAPLCVIAGGETTVTLKGKGKGGRNQEMALAFLAAMRKFPAEIRDLGDRVLFLSAGTDGNDGPTDAAGAFADTNVLRRADELGLDPEVFLAENDSYAFFDKTGALFRTGPTGTNVCDIQLLLVQ